MEERRCYQIKLWTNLKIKLLVDKFFYKFYLKTLFLNQFFSSNRNSKFFLQEINSFESLFHISTDRQKKEL